MEYFGPGQECIVRQTEGSPNLAPITLLLYCLLYYTERFQMWPLFQYTRVQVCNGLIKVTDICSSILSVALA